MNALTVRQMARQNLQRRPFRSAGLMLVVALLAFTLFAGSILTLSLKNGIHSMEQRLGADLMVVPEGRAAEMEGVLLQGKPSRFYFDAAIVQEIAQVDGIEKITPQFFLTSLSAACCSVPVQLIAVDPETDFVIQPWISQAYHNTLAEGEIIAGSEILPDEGNTLTFFGNTYTVVAQLGKTATGLDSSIFMTMNTMVEMKAAAEKKDIQLISSGDPQKSVSTALVRIAGGYDAEQVARTIRFQIPSVDVIVSQNMISGIADSLGTLVLFIYILTAVLWILALLVLLILFSVSANERKKEFAVLRILGATRKKLMRIVLTESTMIALAGGIAGIGIASLVVFPFNNYIASQLQLPYLQPSFGIILLLLGISLLLTVIAGLLSSLYAAAKISRKETYLTMREGE